MVDLFDAADMDYGTSCVYHLLGQMDNAEALAASSVRLFAAEGNSARDGVLADIALASIHVQAGEPDAARLAHHTITSVGGQRHGAAGTRRPGISR